MTRASDDDVFAFSDGEKRLGDCDREELMQVIGEMGRRWQESHMNFRRESGLRGGRFGR